MQSSRRSKAKRLAAGSLGLLLLALVLFSSFYIAAEADHDCAGEDCAICLCIRLCESALLKLGSGILVRIAAAVPALLFLAAVAAFSVSFPLETLISKKVRLND